MVVAVLGDSIGRLRVCRHNLHSEKGGSLLVENKRDRGSLRTHLLEHKAKGPLEFFAL